MQTTPALDVREQELTLRVCFTQHKSANPVKAFATEGGLKVNVELAAVISSMLAVNPEERPSTEQLLGHRGSMACPPQRMPVECCATTELV